MKQRLNGSEPFSYNLWNTAVNCSSFLLNACCDLPCGADIISYKPKVTVDIYMTAPFIGVET